MCGIIYAKNLIDNHPVNNLVKVLYENQKERGQQGFGFVGLKAGQVGTYRATDEKGILKYLNRYPYDEIIFHHRLPTSTQNTLKSTLYLPPETRPQVKVDLRYNISRPKLVEEKYVSKTQTS